VLAWASTGDWVNAVAVKEFRQAVQSRWVIAILMLFLLVNVMFLGSYLALSTDVATNARSGRETLATLLAILMVTCVGFVPLYSGLRLSLERNDSNIDLLFITTIRPGAIVRGKYFSAMALTLLVFSACMPFMVLTYLLGGVDVPTILFLLAAGFTACAVANSLGIFAGSVSGPWLIRGLAAGGAVFLLCYLGGGSIALLNETLFRGRGIASIGAGEFWATVGTMTFIASLVIGLFYVLSVAMLSPVLTNRMLVPRIYFLACWLASCVVTTIWGVHEHDFWPVGGWMVGSGIAWIIIAVAVMGERDTWTSRVRRNIPRGLLLRPLAFLLYTGSAGGLIFATIMFAATVGITYYICTLFDLRYSYGRESFNETAVNITTIFGYVLCYCLTTAFLRITVLRRLPTATLGLITAIVGSFAMIAPYMINFMLQGNTRSNVPWYMLFSPLVLTTYDRSPADSAFPVVLAWLVLGIAAASPWVFRQWRQFVPLEIK
jgi:hypothetical protein